MSVRLAECYPCQWRRLNDPDEQEPCWGWWTEKDLHDGPVLLHHGPRYEPATDVDGACDCCGGRIVRCARSDDPKEA